MAKAKEQDTELAKVSIDTLPGIGPTTAKNIKAADMGLVDSLASAPIAV